MDVKRQIVDTKRTILSLENALCRLLCITPRHIERNTWEDFTLPERFETQMEKYAFQQALQEIFRVIARANKYIDETAPWALAKDESQKARLGGVLYTLLESVRVCSSLLVPFMPDSCERIRGMLGAAPEACTWDAACRWGELPAGAKVSKGENLFPRIDMQKELAELEASQAASVQRADPPVQEEPLNLIGIEDFQKVDLRVAKVLSCEPVKKSDKLLCLQLEVGGEKRQVVSGIHAWYQPEDLIGKKVLMAYNLTPAKLRGVESCGMILAATVGDRAQVVFVDDAIPSGSKLS